MPVASLADRKTAFLFVPFFGAILVVISVNRLASLFGANESTWPLALGVTLLASIAIALPVIHKKNSWVCPVLILVGIPVGIFLDVIWDGAVNSVDRNLFPIEIVIWLVVSGIPIFIGFVVGRAISQRKQ